MISVRVMVTTLILVEIDLIFDLYLAPNVTADDSLLCTSLGYIGCVMATWVYWMCNGYLGILDV